MKKLSALVCVFTVFFMTTSIYAGTDSLSFSGSVADEDTVVMALDGSSLSDMSESVNTDVPMLDVTLSSNNHLGFDVTLSSTNSGELRHTGVGVYDVLKTGTFLQYSVKWDDANLTSNTGSTASAVIDDTILTSDASVDYSTPSSAANDDVCEIEISTAIKDRLFEGTYSDTITVTIADNS